jgi:RND family efflux transporter MFP subunit
VTTIHPHQVQLTVTTQGTVTPRTESTLVAEVAGQIKTVSPAFANGGFFEKGDLLLTIDPRDYEVAVSQAQVQVAQAELAISREKEESNIALQEWERMGRGLPNDLVLRKPQIAQAQAGLEAARGSLHRAALNLERSRIRAPYAGRVRSKIADVGQYVGPGSVLGRVYAVDYAEVRLPIPDQDLAYLDIGFDYRSQKVAKHGPAVKLHAKFAGQTHTWEAHIERVEGEVDPRSRMINLVARVEDPYGQIEAGTRPPLAVGMFVTAEVLGKTVENVYSIPRSALRPNGTVLVVTNDRLFHRTVELLRKDEEEAIVSAGLSAGDQICLSPLDMVVDGMSVRSQVTSEAEARLGGLK